MQAPVLAPRLTRMSGARPAGRRQDEPRLRRLITDKEEAVHIDQQVIDLATGIQRRRDFAAHITGFAAGAVVVGSLNLAGVRGGLLYAATLLTWATACPFSTSVTSCAARSQPMRSAPKPPAAAGNPDQAHSTTCPAGRTAPKVPCQLMTKAHTKERPPGTRQAE
jgi:hypothetical protein